MTRTTAGSLLRSTQAFAQQICDKETLDHGIVFSSARFARLSEANQFREVSVALPRDVVRAYEQAEQCFSAKGLRCLRWASTEGSGDIGSAEFLEDRGFREQRFDTMMLTQWRDLVAPPPQVRIIHARAVRQAYRETFLLGERADVRGHGEPGELMAEAYADRLDDPSFDAFVVLADGIPAGRATLYQVGDIARVMDVRVVIDDAASIMLEALLRHTLGLARRLAMRTVVAQVPREDVRLRTTMEQAGFSRDGELVEYQRAWDAVR